MNQENSEYLVKNFPNLYRDYGGDPKETLMAFGFEVGDGWFGLLKRLSEKLEPMGVVAMQVKEKYGGLRFYLKGGSNEAYDVIDEAELESYKICEVCSAPGAIRDGGWVRVRCDECESKERR